MKVKGRVYMCVILNLTFKQLNRVAQGNVTPKSILVSLQWYPLKKCLIKMIEQSLFVYLNINSFELRISVHILISGFM